MYGPCALCVVSVLSSGITGINTEKRPSSELNFTQPLESVAVMGGGVLLGVAGRGVLVGRGLCSWALREKLNAIVVISIAKNFFMLDVPSMLLKSLGLRSPQIITHEFARMTQNHKHL